MKLTGSSLVNWEEDQKYDDTAIQTKISQQLKGKNICIKGELNPWLVDGND